MSGHARGAGAPERTCVGCGQKAPQRELTRLRVSEGAVGWDPERRGGRGAWLHAADACLLAAVRRKAFGRAFGAPVRVDVQALQAGLTAVAGRD